MSASESEQDSIEPPRRNVWPVAMFLGVVVVLWFVLRPINSVYRGGARREGSLNNLKNIGLSTHNHAAHHDGDLPHSAILGSGGTENFGWAVTLLPYLEAQSVYEGFDLEQPWDDPVNQISASARLKLFMNPRVEGQTAEQGYQLLHYAANSHVFRPDETWGLDQISSADGLTNTVFFGEIGSHFRPWAAPGSLRDPAEGFGDGPQQFGIPDTKLVLLGFGDGSARPVSRDIDPKILKAWATPDGGEEIPE